MSSTAAAIGPASERVPPSTAIARKVTDAASVKTLGETKPTTLAYRAPARPARRALTTNVLTFTPTTSTPQACAPSSLPCRARIARPGRSEVTLNSASRARPATAQTSQ